MGKAKRCSSELERLKSNLTDKILSPAGSRRRTSSYPASSSPSSSSAPPSSWPSAEPKMSPSPKIDKLSLSPQVRLIDLAATGGLTVAQISFLEKRTFQRTNSLLNRFFTTSKPSLTSPEVSEDESSTQSLNPGKRRHKRTKRSISSDTPVTKKPKRFQDPTKTIKIAFNGLLEASQDGAGKKFAQIAGNFDGFEDSQVFRGKSTILERFIESKNRHRAADPQKIERIFKVQMDEDPKNCYASLAVAETENNSIAALKNYRIPKKKKEGIRKENFIGYGKMICENNNEIGGKNFEIGKDSLEIGQIGKENIKIGKKNFEIRSKKQQIEPKIGQIGQENIKIGKKNFEIRSGKQQIEPEIGQIDKENIEIGQIGSEKQQIETETNQIDMKNFEIGKENLKIDQIGDKNFRISSEKQDIEPQIGHQISEEFSRKNSEISSENPDPELPKLRRFSETSDLGSESSGWSGRNRLRRSHPINYDESTYDEIVREVTLDKIISTSGKIGKKSSNLESRSEKSNKIGRRSESFDSLREDLSDSEKKFTQIGQKSDTIDVTKEDLNHLEGKSTQIEQKSAQIDQSLTKIGSKSENSDELRADLSDSDVKLTKIGKKSVKIGSKSDNLKADLSDSEEKLAKIGKKSVKIRSKSDNLKADLSDSEEKLAKIGKKSVEIGSKSDNLRADLSDSEEKPAKIGKKSADLAAVPSGSGEKSADLTPTEAEAPDLDTIPVEFQIGLKEFAATDDKGRIIIHSHSAIVHDKETNKRYKYIFNTKASSTLDATAKQKNKQTINRRKRGLDSRSPSPEPPKKIYKGRGRPPKGYEVKKVDKEENKVKGKRGRKKKVPVVNACEESDCKRGSCRCKQDSAGQRLPSMPNFDLSEGDLRGETLSSQVVERIHRLCELGNPNIEAEIDSALAIACPVNANRQHLKRLFTLLLTARRHQAPSGLSSTPDLEAGPSSRPGAESVLKVPRRAMLIDLPDNTGIRSTRPQKPRAKVADDLELKKLAESLKNLATIPEIGTLMAPTVPELYQKTPAAPPVRRRRHSPIKVPESGPDPSKDKPKLRVISSVSTQLTVTKVVREIPETLVPNRDKPKTQNDLRSKLSEPQTQSPPKKRESREKRPRERRRWGKDSSESSDSKYSGIFDFRDKSQSGSESEAELDRIGPDSIEKIEKFDKVTAWLGMRTSGEAQNLRENEGQNQLDLDRTPNQIDVNKTQNQNKAQVLNEAENAQDKKLVYEAQNENRFHKTQIENLPKKTPNQNTPVKSQDKKDLFESQNDNYSNKAQNEATSDQAQNDNPHRIEGSDLESGGLEVKLSNVSEPEGSQDVGTEENGEKKEGGEKKDDDTLTDDDEDDDSSSSSSESSVSSSSSSCSSSSSSSSSSGFVDASQSQSKSRSDLTNSNGPAESSEEKVDLESDLRLNSDDDDDDARPVGEAERELDNSFELRLEEEDGAREGKGRVGEGKNKSDDEEEDADFLELMANNEWSDECSEPEEPAAKKSPTLDRYQGMESSNFENFMTQNNNEFESTYNSIDFSSQNNPSKSNPRRPPGGQRRRSRWDPSTPSTFGGHPNSFPRGQNMFGNLNANINPNVSHNNYSGFNRFNCGAGIGNPKLQPLNGGVQKMRNVYDPQVDGNSSLTEVKLQFKNLCHFNLKHGNCAKVRTGNCQFNHTIPNKLIYVYMESEQEIKQILEHAISSTFLSYLTSVYEKSLAKLDSSAISQMTRNILSNLPIENVRFYLDASIRVLLSKHKSLSSIANSLAEQVVQILVQNPRRETLPTVVMDALSEKIVRGAYWDTLKKFFSTMPRVEPARVAIVLQESLDHKKSLAHTTEVNQMILEMFDSARDEVDQTLLADFNNYFEDQQRQAVAEIASPSPDRRESSPTPGTAVPLRPVRQIPEDDLPPGVTFEAPRKVGENSADNNSNDKLKLSTVDTAAPLSAYRTPMYEFHSDTDELRTALLQKNYLKVITILRKYKTATLENPQPFSRGFYRILCTEVLNPEHIAPIVDTTGAEFILVSTVDGVTTVGINYSR